jgi:DNA-binding transcriptional MerR regulator
MSAELMSISEVVRRTGMSLHGLRYSEWVGLITRDITRTSSGPRAYAAQVSALVPVFGDR